MPTPTKSFRVIEQMQSSSDEYREEHVSKPAKAPRKRRPQTKVSKPAIKPRKAPAAGRIVKNQLDDDPFGERAFKRDPIDIPRPGTLTPDPFPAAAEDDPFGELASACSRSRHSNLEHVTELDPFGEGMSTNIPRVRKATPVVRFADQVPPSKKRKLAGASPAHPRFPHTEPASSSPQPPNALEKVIEAAGGMRNPDHTIPGPSSVEGDTRQVDTYPRLLSIHKRLRGTPTIRVPYGVAADHYLLEAERELELEKAFIDDLQYTKGKISRLKSMLDNLT